MVASPVRPAPGYTGSPTSSISGSAGSGGAISKTSYSNRENPMHEVMKDPTAGRRSNGSQSESPISSSGSTTSSSAVRKISSSENEGNKLLQIASPIPANRASYIQSPSTVSLQMPPARHPAQIDHFQQSQQPQDKVNNASANLNQRIRQNFLPSTPVGMSQQQFSEMEYLTSRYLRQQEQQLQQILPQLQILPQQQQQQQQQIQMMFEQQQLQMQEEARKSVYRSGGFDTQLNVLRKEMVKFLSYIQPSFML